MLARSDNLAFQRRIANATPADLERMAEEALADLHSLSQFAPRNPIGALRHRCLEAKFDKRYDQVVDAMNPEQRAALWPVMDADEVPF